MFIKTDFVYLFLKDEKYVILSLCNEFHILTD